MGEENPIFGVGSIYVQTPDGKEMKLGEPVNVGGLELRDEDMIVEQSEPVYRGGHIEVNLSVIVDKDAPITRFIERLRRKYREERRALLWAVTHGYTVAFLGTDANDENCAVRYEVHRPSEVRQLLRYCPFVPQYEIRDHNGRVCDIRKSKRRRVKIYEKRNS